MTWSDFKQKGVKHLNSQNVTGRVRSGVKKCNKEPLMQFFPDSKLVGTLSNNSLLNHLDYDTTTNLIHISATRLLKKYIRARFRTVPNQIEKLILINTKNEHYGTHINNYMTCIRPLHNTYVSNIHNPWHALKPHIFSFLNFLFWNIHSDKASKKTNPGWQKSTGANWKSSQRWTHDSGHLTGQLAVWVLPSPLVLSRWVNNG